MRLLFIADGRSPTALNWIRHFVQPGHEVHLLSTYACDPELDLTSLTVVSVAFSGAHRPVPNAQSTPPTDRPTRVGRSLSSASTIAARSWLRHWLGPLTIGAAARSAGQLIDRIAPDLVHAMRIPFEGMLAARANRSAPLLLSVWGNDFTLHAPASPWMRRCTRQTLQRAAGLHTDCRRDLRLARQWGFDHGRPSVTLPGNGGVRPEFFHPGPADPAPGSALAGALADVDPEAPVIINPRGFRAYVRTDSFFEAIPLVLAQYPQAVFLCPGMAGEGRALRWVGRLGIADSMRLLPKLDPQGMAAAFRRAWVSVSPSEHDGTPNTLLEAMACGALPVAGDLESIREWISPGENGLLVDPARPASLAAALNRGLGDADLRQQAARLNAGIVASRASYAQVMAQATDFYNSLAA